MKRNERDIFAAIVDAATRGKGIDLSPQECATLAKHPDIARRDASVLSGEWRQVPGYPAYEVSSDGRVRRGGRVLRATRSRYGHSKVTLYNGTPHGKSGRGRRMRVHRLVALAFIGPPPFDGAIVRHRNGHAHDDRAVNLAWGTHEENTQDRVHHHKFGKPDLVDGALTKAVKRFRWRRKPIATNEMQK